MIFRAVPEFNAETILAASTPRAPGNVPYLVDNIWEWLRPDGYPSRRYAAFASPAPMLAAASSAGFTLANVCRVILPPGAQACQIVYGEKPEDARHHADVAALSKLVIRRLLNREWFQRPVASRWPEAALFLPCATREEIEESIANSSLLDADQIRMTSRFWRDVKLIDPKDSSQFHETGEIFFEGRYRLEQMVE